MRVLLDATGIGSGAGGDETMLRGHLLGLAAVAPSDDRYVVLAAAGAELPTEVLGDERFVIQTIQRRPGAVHFAVDLPRVVRECRPAPDLVFSAIHAPVVSPVPRVLMVQDLSFEHRPADYPWSTFHRLHWSVRVQVHQANVVTTLSTHARRDLIRTYGLDPSRVMLVPCAVLPAPSHDGSGMVAARKSLRDEGVDGPFLLYLGNLHPRKNVGTVIEAFGRARASGPELDGHRLVIAGGRWWGTGEEEVARRCAPEGSVVFLGRVDEAQREVLLRDATALCYLSLFEGFGLPPLEAMARGTVVIASDRTSVPEVVGDAAIVVDPLDVDAVAQAMRRVATDDDLAATLRERGLRRAAHYSVANTGQALRDAFTAAIDQPWTRLLQDRRDDIFDSMGLDGGDDARSFDVEGATDAARTARLVDICSSIPPGEIALVRVRAPSTAPIVRLRPLSGDRLWRTVEDHDCVVLGSWAGSDRSVVAVIRRSSVSG